MHACFLSFSIKNGIDGMNGMNGGERERKKGRIYRMGWTLRFGSVWSLLEVLCCGELRERCVRSGKI